MEERDEAIRTLYEIDMRARMKRSQMPGDPYLKRAKDGTFKRTDLEADYQTFKASWLKS